MAMKSQIPCRKVSLDIEKYEVLEKIGHGSFGIIHKVRRKSDGLILCRKEISYSRMSVKEREQLSSELSILKELRHKNIVSYYEREHFKSSQDLRLYMEYCGNGDLGRYIKNLKIKNEFADEQFVWTIFSQLVSALYRCHYGEDAPAVPICSSTAPKDGKVTPATTSSFMILHRDLKPENVFLDENYSVKLGDFGLSKILQTQGFAETYVGTPFYMSPEICNGEKYTLHSDVWSLGCIIYELCARQPPFNANSHYNLVQKIQSGKVARIPVQYSNELHDVIVSCLSVSPSRRPDTAQLVNHPRVNIIRREHALSELVSELEKKAALLSEKDQSIRTEVETRVRSECDARCQLEHSQQVEMAKQEHFQTLRNQFEAEVQRRVAIEVEAQVHRIRLELESRYADQHLTDASVPSLSSGSQSSASDPELPAPIDGVNSPKRVRGYKRGTRTPFSRAQTYSVNQPSPMDITMVDPSPAAPVSQLNLSPRRLAGQEGQNQNIFTANDARKWSAGGVHPPSPTMSIADDSDLEACLESLETPTRVKPRDSLGRPLSSGMLRMPPLFHQKSGHGKADPAAFAAVRRPMSVVPVVGASPNKKGVMPSPQKFQPRRPAPPSPAVAGSCAPVFQSKRGNEDLLKTALHGRTLVELSQNRVKARLDYENASLGGKKKAYADPIMWDPSRDVMPSPFISRKKQPENIAPVVN